MADTLWDEAAHFLCHFPLSFPFFPPGIRSLQPHRPHHPGDLVPLRPEPHHSEVHREETAFVQVYHLGE